MDPKNTLDPARPVEQSSSCIQFIKDNKWKIITGIAAVALAAIALALLLTPPGLIIGLGIGLSASAIAIIGLSSSCAGLVAAGGFILAIFLEKNAPATSKKTEPVEDLEDSEEEEEVNENLKKLSTREFSKEDVALLLKTGAIAPTEIRVGMALVDNPLKTPDAALSTPLPKDEDESPSTEPSRSNSPYEEELSSEEDEDFLELGTFVENKAFDQAYVSYTHVVENPAFDSTGQTANMKIKDALKYKKEPKEEEKFPEDIGEMQENPAFDPAFNNYTQVRTNPAYTKFQEGFVPPVMNILIPKSQSGQVIRPELTGVDEDMPKNIERRGRFSKKSLDEAADYIQKLKSEKQAELDKRAQAAALAKEIEDKRAKARAEFNSVD